MIVVSIFEYLKKYELPMPLWISKPELEQDSPGWDRIPGSMSVRRITRLMDRLTPHDRLLYRKLFPLPVGWDDWMPKQEWSLDDRRLCQGLLCLTPWEPQTRWQMPLDGQGIRIEKEDTALGFWELKLFAARVEKEDSGVCDFYSVAHFVLCCHALMCKDKDKVEQLRLATAEDPFLEREWSQICRFRKPGWKKLLPHVLGMGLYRCATQNNEMREALCSTEDAPLYYVDPEDPVLGGTFENGVFRGQNLYGLALMQVRSELQRVYDNLLFCLGDPNKKEEEESNPFGGLF